MNLSKERREEIWYWLDDPYKYDQEPIDTEGEEPHDPPTYGELRALLDMADERDRYRALLDGARDSLVIFEQVLSDHFPESSVGLLVHRTRRERIDAALEGKE